MNSATISFGAVPAGATIKVQCPGLESISDSWGSTYVRDGDAWAAHGVRGGEVVVIITGTDVLSALAQVLEPRTSSFLERLVERMDEYAELDKGRRCKIVQSWRDGDTDVVEVEVLNEVLEEEDEKLTFVMADVGQFRGSNMVELREEPRIFVSAVPIAILSVVMEL